MDSGYFVTKKDSGQIPYNYSNSMVLKVDHLEDDNQMCQLLLLFYCIAQNRIGAVESTTIHYSPISD